MNTLETLIQKIEAKSHVVGVIGLGYVGLPLVQTVCSNNIKVIGFDIDPHKIDKLNKGMSYIDGVTDENLTRFLSKNLLEVTNDFGSISQVDVIVICVPTPLDCDDNPDLSYVEKTVRNIAPHLKDGGLIVLESTTYPGTVNEIIRPIVSKEKKVEDVFLAYSPEREDPGNINFETSTMPKLVGAENEAVLDLCVKFYSQFIKKVIPVSSPTLVTETILPPKVAAAPSKLKFWAPVESRV